MPTFLLRGYCCSKSKFYCCYMSLDPRISEIIERVTSREELEYVHAEMVGGSGNGTLRIFIDKPGGVTHEDCAAVSDQVGLILDVEDIISSNYTLEVSSPGLDRGLYKPADYERFAGLQAHIKLLTPLDGQRNFHGILIGLDEAVALLDDEKGNRQRLPLNQIAKANVEIEPMMKQSD